MEKVQKVLIDKKRCKGCQLCISVCPVGILKVSDEINNYGYHPVEVVGWEKCLSCGNCALICPDLAIKIYKEE